jgi:hypothetical protein
MDKKTRAKIDKNRVAIVEEIRLTASQHKALAFRAQQLGVTVEEFASYALLRYIDERTPLVTDSVEVAA